MPEKNSPKQDLPETNAKDKLSFDLPQQNKKSGQRSSLPVLVLLVLILAAVSANIVIAITQPATGSLGTRGSSDNLDADTVKKLALKLEKQDLVNASADAWKEYIRISDTDDSETALIWYRIGKLFQKNHDYENALAGYYRSESYADVDSIASDIGIRIQECLESLGKFSAMQQELEDRVGISPSENDAGSNKNVVAEIGTLKITAADLDRQIETNIEQQMRMLAPFLPDEERNQQKETLLKQFSSSESKKMFLNQFVVEEILYRKARENKLLQEPYVKDLIQSQERMLLSRLVLEKEYDNRINLTPSDLKTFYEANKDDFKNENHTTAFEDVKNDVYKALRSQKEKEIRQQLINQLKDDYDVVIHQGAFSAEPPVKSTAAAPAAGSSKTP